MEEHQKLINWILKVAVGSLASIMVVVVLVLMVGIFLPNEQVDNNEIFKIIGPAFNTVIGAFVGLLGGLSLANKKEEKKEEPPAAPDPVSELTEEHEDHIA